MRNTLAILLSTATIGLGSIVATTPAAANPALIIPLAAAAAGGLAIGGAVANEGQYPYQWQGSDRWMGETRVAPPGRYPAQAYPPAVYEYPNTAYEPAPYPYAANGPGYGGPGYAGSCHIQTQRIPNGWTAEWRNFTVCD